MPDSAPKPEGQDPHESGHKIKAVIPHNSHKSTQLTVEAGTHEHTAMVEDVATEAAADLLERRRPGVGVTLNTPPSGGLSGWSAIIANMSAVGVLMLFLFLVYNDMQRNERERRGQDREDRAAERSQQQAAFAAMTSSLSLMTVRNDARDTKFDQAVDEIRRAVMKQEQFNNELLSVMKSIRDKKPEPEEATGAPMPRVKVTAGAG